MTLSSFLDVAAVFLGTLLALYTFFLPEPVPYVLLSLSCIGWVLSRATSVGSLSDPVPTFASHYRRIRAR